jgi:hypothetical protein
MSYNRFQWWRSLPRHKKKDERSHPIARIENGDFEYPWDVKKDLEHAQADLRRLEQDLENRMSKSSKTDVEHEEVKDLILNEIYEKKIRAEKTLKRSRSKDIVKDSIQNTMEIYDEYEKKIVEYVENKTIENRSEVTV